jgi:hypothetical protein
MKSGKRVFGIIIISLFISLLLVSSISLVFGADKNLEGELDEAAVARLSILDLSDPVIVYVSNVTGEIGGAAPNLVKLKSRTNGNTLVKFWFLAQQGASGSEPGELSLGTTSRTTLTRSGELSRINASCNAYGEVSCGSLCTGTAINFTCSVPMKYYDGNGTWNINVSVKAPTTLWGYNLTKTFKVDATFAATALTNYLNWTNPALTTATTNRLSDNNISVENNGNVPYSGVVVNATELAGLIRPAEVILANRFGANGCGGAGTAILSQDTDVAVSGFTAIRAVSDLGRTSNLTFCVISLAGLGLSSQDYNSTRPWVLTLAQS